MRQLKKCLVSLSFILCVVFSTASASAESELIKEKSNVLHEELVTLNINTADADTIADLMHGVGAKKARAIVEYRNAHGPFENHDSLLAVRGIGKGTITRNKKRILF